VVARIVNGITRFKHLSLLAAILAFCVVVLGAYVRLSDAGLGCPDWPGCYGTLTVPQSEAAISLAQQAFPSKPVESGKAWKEMAHRYLAGTLGLLVLALAVMAVRQRRQLRTPVLLSVALVLLIVMQAMLGMWTVTLLLKPAIVTLHLLGGMTTLAVLSWIAVKHYSCEKIVLSSGQVAVLRLFLPVLLLQLMLGGWTSTNYAALACTDFPTCHGVWWPQMDVVDGFHVVRELGASAHGGNLGLDALTAIQWMHRLGAILVLTWGMLSIYILRAVAPKVALCLLLALGGQVALGISNLILHLPLVLAVLHNAGAALLVVILVFINAKLAVTYNQAVEGSDLCKAA
jgi:heme a synthase